MSVSSLSSSFISPSSEAPDPRPAPESIHAKVWEMLGCNFHPEHSDVLIGLDPYRLFQRPARAMAPTLIPVELIQAEESDEIAKQIHCIWLGHPIYQARPDYWLHLCQLNRLVKDAGFKLFLWCHESSIDGPLIEFCQKEGIELLNLFDVFPDGLPLESAIHYCIQRFPPNYAEASDLIRYAVLKRFGGIYADLDTVREIVRSDKMSQRASGSSFCCFSDPDRARPLTLVEAYEDALRSPGKIMRNETTDNDFWIARPRHPFFSQILAAAQDEYQHPMAEEKLKERIVREHSRMPLYGWRTLVRTGPAAVNRVLFEHDAKIPAGRWFLSPSDFSWRHPVGEVPLEQMTAILTTILRELKESPATLVLLPFEGLGEDYLYELIAFLAEHFPKECARIRTCLTHFASLKSRIQKIFPSLSDGEAPREICEPRFSPKKC
jgi:hypothetical protein